VGQVKELRVSLGTRVKQLEVELEKSEARALHTTQKLEAELRY
jgi:hypothetical protein